MLGFKTTAKQLIRIFLSACFGRSRSIPVMAGPLKGRRLPKQVALKNLAMVFGQYEPYVVRELFSISEPVKVAYDVGAHVGYTTLALAERVGSNGKVFAFEPEPENIAVLQQLIIQNGLERIVCVIPVALADTNGEEKLIKWKSSSMYLLESAIDGQEVYDCSAISVVTSNLDSFVFEQLNPAPDLLKIDVEGAEALVIQGGLRALDVYSPKLLIEIHGPRNAQEIWRLLQSLDYLWYRLTPKGKEPILSERQLLSFFTKDSWTQHFLLNRLNKSDNYKSTEV